MNPTSRALHRLEMAFREGRPKRPHLSAEFKWKGWERDKVFAASALTAAASAASASSTVVLLSSRVPRMALQN